jgi:hypothetical protein
MIKEQPKEFCLSTIESTLSILELLQQQGIETIEAEKFEKFLTPFTSMVEYQIECATHSRNSSVRFKPRREEN